jgi:hypothetical protein
MYGLPFIVKETAEQSITYDVIFVLDIIRWWQLNP